MYYFQRVLLLYQSYMIFVTPVFQSYSCFKIIYTQQAIIINSYNNVKLKKKCNFCVTEKLPGDEDALRDQNM